MSRFTKCFALSLAVLCMGVLAIDAQQSIPPKPAWPGYGLAIFLGFGTGQYYLGANGTPFLIGDIAGVAVMAGGYAYMIVAALGAPDPYAAITTSYIIIAAGGLVYSVTRVWEIVDIFGTAERMRQAGKVVRIVPDISVRPTGVSMGVSVRY
jgi:hypothetical protein